MPGFSITLLLLPTKDEVDVPLASHILSLLDDKPDVPGWKWSSSSSPLPQSQQVLSGNQVATIMPNIAVPKTAPFIENIKRAARALINAESEITRMDSIAGDGDCGLTLKVS